MVKALRGVNVWKKILTEQAIFELVAKEEWKYKRIREGLDKGELVEEGDKKSKDESEEKAGGGKGTRHPPSLQPWVSDQLSGTHLPLDLNRSLFYLAVVCFSHLFLWCLVSTSLLCSLLSEGRFPNKGTIGADALCFQHERITQRKRENCHNPNMLLCYSIYLLII